MLSPPVAGQDNIHATRPNETVPRRQPLGASMGCGASMPVDQGAPAQNKQEAAGGQAQVANQMYQTMQQRTSQQPEAAEKGVNLVQMFQQRMSHRKWSIRDPSEWTQLDVEAWLETWQVQANLEAVKSLNGARILGFREVKDVAHIVADPAIQVILVKRLKELRKVSRHIKRQQLQLQQMLAQGLKDLRTSNANARAAASKRDAAATSGEPTGTAAAPAASTSGSRLAPMASTPGAARDPRTAPHAPSAAAAEGPGGRAKAGSGTEAAGNGAPGARVSGYAGQGQMDNSSMAVGGDSQNVDPPRKPGGVQSLRSDDAVVDRVRAASSGEKVEDKGGSRLAVVSMEVPAGTVQDGTLAKEHAAETGPEISNGDTMAQA